MGMDRTDSLEIMYNRDMTRVLRGGEWSAKGVKRKSSAVSSV